MTMRCTPPPEGVPALIAWCEEQIGLQRDLSEAAKAVVTVYATEQTQGATIGPDTEEASLRGRYANNFWMLASHLRRLLSSEDERRAEAKEARRWREDADNLRIKRVRITICTNRKG